MNDKFVKLLAYCLATAAFQLTQAWDPAKDRSLCQNGAFCLTSFQWCSVNENDKNKGCSFPENTWPLNHIRTSPKEMTPAVLLWNATYKVTWQTGDASNEPVLLLWTPGTITYGDGWSDYYGRTWQKSKNNSLTS